MLRNLTRIALSLLVMLLCALPAPGDELTPAQIQADKRLATPVTLRAKHLPLPEVLELLGKQAKIALECDERDSASGVEVWVWCNEVPLHRILNALWSEMSHTSGKWTWKVSQISGTYRYSLLQPQAAKDRAARLRTYIQKAFETHIAIMMELAQMPEEERKKQSKRLIEAHCGESTLSSGLMTSEATWKVIRVFAQATPPALQLAVARGEREWSVAVQDMSPLAQKELQELWKLYDIQIGRNGVMEPAPIPQRLRFYATDRVSGKLDITPLVMMDMEKAGAMSCLGNYALEEGVRNLFRKEWRIKGDTLTHKLAQNKVAESDIEKPDTTPKVPLPDDILPPDAPIRNRVRIRNGLEWRFGQVADGLEVPLVAIFPRNIARDPGSSIGKPAQEFLERTYRSPFHLMTKWRDGVLLVNFAEWFLLEDGVLPYRITRKYFRSKSGYLSLSELVELSSELSDAQAKNLGETYPALAELWEIRPLLLLGKRYPALLTSQGIGLDDRRRKALLTMPRFAENSAILNGTARSLRIQSEMLGSQMVIRVELEREGMGWSRVGNYVTFGSLSP